MWRLTRLACFSPSSNHESAQNDTAKTEFYNRSRRFDACQSISNRKYLVEQQTQRATRAESVFTALAMRIPRPMASAHRRESFAPALDDARVAASERGVAIMHFFDA